MSAHFQMVKSNGWLTGFGNLLPRESRRWWRTRRWWLQALLWFAILNGFVMFGLFVMPGMIEQQAAEMDQAAAAGNEVMTAEEFQQDVPNALFGLATFLLPVGVIVLTQNQVLGEKRSGVAAWIMSKPVARPAYLLAKLVADAVGILLVLVLLQMILAYALLAATIPLNAADFARAVGLLVMLLLFYQAFTLMMSVVGSSTELVLGVSLGVLLGGLVLKSALASVIGDLVFITPWVLPDAIPAVLAGQPLPPQMYTTLIAVPVLTLICLIVMFWQFQRQEL